METSKRENKQSKPNKPSKARAVWAMMNSDTEGLDLHTGQELHETTLADSRPAPLWTLLRVAILHFVKPPGTELACFRPRRGTFSCYWPFFSRVSFSSHAIFF